MFAYSESREGQITDIPTFHQVTDTLMISCPPAYFREKHDLSKGTKHSPKKKTNTAELESANRGDFDIIFGIPPT